MKYPRALLLVMLSTATVTWAQEWPKVEIAAEYSYLRFAPSGPYTKGHSLNGGGGSIGYNWNEYLGIKLDLQGYTSNKTGFNIPPNLTFPNGLTGNVQSNLFTYLIGPQFKVRAHMIQPFAHLLFGGAHTNVYGNAFKTLCGPFAGIRRRRGHSYQQNRVFSSGAGCIFADSIQQSVHENKQPKQLPLFSRNRIHIVQWRLLNSVALRCRLTASFLTGTDQVTPLVGAQLRPSPFLCSGYWTSGSR
jgi:hypothetical protein